MLDYTIEIKCLFLGKDMPGRCGISQDLIFTNKVDIVANAFGSSKFTWHFECFVLVSPIIPCDGVEQVCFDSVCVSFECVQQGGVVADFDPAAYFGELDLFYMVKSAYDELAIKHDLNCLECIRMQVGLRLRQYILFNIFLKMVLPLFRDRGGCQQVRQFQVRQAHLECLPIIEQNAPVDWLVLWLHKKRIMIYNILAMKYKPTRFWCAINAEYPMKIMYKQYDVPTINEMRYIYYGRIDRQLGEYTYVYMNMNMSKLGNILIVDSYKQMNLNWVKQQESRPYAGDDKEGYTLTYIDHLKSLLMFGGTHTPNSEIHLYNLISKEWSVPKVSAPKPSPRKHHTAVYQKSIKGLIVYGGQADKGRSLDTFDVLFIEDWKWRKLLFKSVPLARQLHTFTPISNGNFLIFGGITLPYGSFLQDLWILKGVDKLKDTKTLQIAGCTCTQIAGKGNAPPGRYGHQAYFYNDNYYVIGGQAESEEQQFTVYMLDMKRMHWSRHTFNVNLSQIVGFSLLRNPALKNQVFIFGGVIKSSKKANNHLYSLTFDNQPALKKLQKLPQLDTMIFNQCCELPFNQVCGMCCCFVNQRDLLLYRVEVRNNTQSELDLQEYLKYIKNQQFLSQELLRKVHTLENLYRQMQSYSSLLLRQYNESGDLDEEIQKQKKFQKQLCIQLKSQYSQIDQVYSENLSDMKQARRELARINQHFQGYIETQRDEDQ